jgi:hypothetical protein
MNLVTRPTLENAMESARRGDIARKVSLGMTSARGLAHQRGDRDDGVAVCAQGLDQDRQRGDGCGAIAAAVVHEDDGAAELRLGLHGLKLVENRLSDLGGSLAGILVPVVGVDLVADDGVAVPLDGHRREQPDRRCRAPRRCRRGTEVERLDAELAGE